MNQETDFWTKTITSSKLSSLPSCSCFQALILHPELSFGLYLNFENAWLQNAYQSEKYVLFLHGHTIPLDYHIGSHMSAICTYILEFAQA